MVRHSQANHVAVELSKKEGFLHLIVRDDGVGFDVAAIRERAVNGASLGVLSTPASFSIRNAKFTSAPMRLSSPIEAAPPTLTWP